MSMTNRKNNMKDSLNIAIKTTFLSFLALCSSCATNQEVVADHYENCIKNDKKFGYLPKGFCAESARKLANNLNELDAWIARVETEADVRRKKEREDYERSDAKKTLDTIERAIVAAGDIYSSNQIAKQRNQKNASSNPTPAEIASAVTTASRNPYGNNIPNTSSSDIGTRTVISEPAPSQSKRLPYKANANACIGLRGNQLVNNCSRGVWITFCVLNPRQTKNFFDSSDAFKCPSGGLEQISSNSANGLVWHGEVNFFACYADDIGTMKTNFYGTEPRTAAPGTMQGNYTGAYHGLCAGYGADGRQDVGGSDYAK